MIIQRDARIITSAMNIQAWCQFFEASTRQTRVRLRRWRAASAVKEFFLRRVTS